MRITGGALRSRRLVAPDGSATRPTSDRVREALFSILAGHGVLRDARVLDLYAGSGALSFEALSRGAAHVTLVERGREAVAAIRANMTALGVAAQTKVVAAAVERALGDGPTSLARAEPFDLVLIDPPYADVATGLVAKTLDDAELACRVAREGLVVLEHASRSESPLLRGLALIETRRYGDTSIALFARSAESNAKAESL